MHLIREEKEACFYFHLTVQVLYLRMPCLHQSDSCCWFKKCYKYFSVWCRTWDRGSSIATYCGTKGFYKTRDNNYPRPHLQPALTKCQALSYICYIS